MDVDTFSALLHNQFRVCEDVLVDKRREYATDDVLHNFRQAADLQGISLQSALAGMMAKHTISIYDMCTSDEDYPLSKWDEKIIDHINYLFLLSAIVLEDSERRQNAISLPKFHNLITTED